MNSLHEQIADAFSEDVVSFMKTDFEEQVAIIRDPETGEETLHKLSGEDIAEDEFYALLFFEKGWTACLLSLQAMGNDYVDKGMKVTYAESPDEELEQGDTDARNESDSRGDD